MTLPSELGDEGAYDETIVEAVFSYEWLWSDNVGDMNQDGIPDIYESYLSARLTGVEEVENRPLMVYAKNGAIFYQIPAAGEVKVFNNQGIEIECFHVEQGNGRHDVSTWPNGVYVFHYTNGQTTYTEKFIK